MAAITRVLQKIFGATGDAAEFGQVGSDSAGSPATTKDLATIQSLSQYEAGLFAITENLLNPPRGEDFNALLYLITSQLKYLFQSGVPEWIATENYYANKSIVIGSDGNLYKSKTGSDVSPNINHNPVGDTTNWAIVWDITNDGTGSGLDADLVDGSHYNANDILTKLKTVDGPGSGLDADLLDGMHLDQIIRRTSMTSGSANNCILNTWTTCTPGVYDTPVAGSIYWNILTLGDSANSQQLAFHYSDTGGMFTRRKVSGTWGGWKTIWNASNDGSGSGLDADLLDGLHGAAYAKVNTATSARETDMPVGTYIAARASGVSNYDANSVCSVYTAGTSSYVFASSGASILAGTWRSCGLTYYEPGVADGRFYLVRRVA